ncbi:hypothetical protein [Metabacillus endolithicus]|uniref:Uncharacterized protein n=1 Tax=Metabacillus endolithicus TaxID=1535204 RepID=A0ABW5C061_9BACI|nr:hypothetical protein [Metabacillus endolithicus]UPG62588.1 hypothetical protein MVE64_19275 [Metabacillus endolithicus]
MIAEEEKQTGEFMVEVDLDVDGTAVILFNLISFIGNADLFGYSKN